MTNLDEILQQINQSKEVTPSTCEKISKYLWSEEFEDKDMVILKQLIDY